MSIEYKTTSLKPCNPTPTLPLSGSRREDSNADHLPLGQLKQDLIFLHEFFVT